MPNMYQFFECKLSTFSLREGKHHQQQKKEDKKKKKMKLISNQGHEKILLVGFWKTIYLYLL